MVLFGLFSFIVFLDVLNEGFKYCVLLPIINLLVLSFIFGNIYCGLLEQELPAK